MSEPQTILAQALAHHEAGRLTEALESYRRVTAAAPDHFEAHGLQGLALETLGRFEEAAGCYRRALEIRPDVPELLLSLGNVLRTQKKLAAAEEHLRRCVALVPGSAEALCSLGLVLGGQDRRDEAAALYARALEADPGSAQAHNCLGSLQAERGRTDAAIESFRRAVAADPGLVSAHLNLGNALSKQGRHEDAKACYRRAIALEPDDPDLYGELFIAAMREGDHAGALALCESVLRDYPGTVDMLAFKSVLLHEIGRSDEALALFDCPRFLRPRQIEVPPGYGDLSAFNAALRAHVLGHPTLVESSSIHATRFGAHTGDLLSEPKGPMADFEAAIVKSVERYMQDLPDDPGHPFIAGVPARWRLNVWAVVMGEKGHQVSHTHPSAWLSGVYYAAVPDDIRADDPDCAGWIEFGRPDDEITIAKEPIVERIRPQEGLFVLFPAYFYHNTVPYGGAGPRISIAFDVTPL